MASIQNSAEPPLAMPKLPVPHREFIRYISDCPRESIKELLQPYNEYEAKLREIFAQHRDDEILQNPQLNAIPIFDGHESLLQIKARQVNDEAANQQFIMPLKPKDRKSDRSKAVVASITDFKNNFNIFSESSLVDLDWSNVVAAGSSVVTPLLPVPGKYGSSKKALR